MRVIENSEEYLGTKQEEPKEQNIEPKKDSFDDILVKEIGNEYYGINFFGSIGIHFKSRGLCELAKFYWKIAEETMEVKKKIKEFLLKNEVDFAYPQIDAVKLNKDDIFEQALKYENDRIEHLYTIVEKAPCSLTKGLVGKLIKKHMDIQHLLSLANKMKKLSKDPLLVQESICKLICHE